MEEWCRQILTCPSLLRLYPKVYSTFETAPVVAHVNSYVPIASATSPWQSI